MVRAGQSSERAALIYQHSNLERQREVADGIDARVRAEREKADSVPDARVRAEREKADSVPDVQASGTERAREA